MRDDLTEELLLRIRRLFGGDHGLELPPKVFREMEGRFTDYVEGTSMTVTFPLFERYQGPTGVVQGGIIAAAFDNSFGPFSYLVSGAFTTTVQMGLTFVRPLRSEDQELSVEVSLIELTDRFVFLEAVGRGAAGKVVARGSSVIVILQRG